MFRIGIIGTENSHAMTFSKLINLPAPETGKLRYPDARIVGVYGPDMASAEAIVKDAGVEFIAKSPEEFHGRADAMIICNRKGSLHVKYAMPFIQKGMPLFIDKPFTSDVEEAEALAEAAKMSGSKLCGGSGCKLAYDVTLLNNSVKSLTASGDFVTASLNYAADPSSEYDGFYFYAPHLTEIALAIFGKDVRSMFALEKNGSRVCVWRYDQYDVTLNFTKDVYASTAVLYAKNGNIVRNIDISMIYGQEVDHFIHMLRTGEMPGDYESLITPVRMIAAIEEAVKTGKEVVL